jgi:integrase
MSPRGKRKLETPEAFKVDCEIGTLRIVVEEMPSRPGYVVMRRWVDRWVRKSLGRMTLRDERGAVLESARDAAKVAAANWYHEITGQKPEAIALPAVPTIGQTWGLISAPATGKYPHRTAFRDELQRALEYAVLTWGGETPWTAIDSDHWTTLLRKRLSEQVQQQRTGLRSTEITVSRILTAANWLRKKKRIPLEAAVIDSEWRDEMRQYWKGLTGEASVPEPFRPRHTDDEARRLIARSWDVDHRFGLMMALGAELRLGQVARAKRSDLDLVANQFTVKGSGDKKGETIELTVGQSLAVQRALVGYLRDLERSGVDYYLFPAGRMLGKAAGNPIARVDQGLEHIEENTIRDWYWSAETLAGISRVKGRGVYGVRRAAVDHALGQKVSQQGLKSLGGWSSDEMPRRVYADQENVAGRKEAATVRSSFRGESDA